MRSSLHFPQDEPYSHGSEHEDSNLPPSSPSPAKPVLKMQVLYEFEARNAQELTVAQGEILEVRPMPEARKRSDWWEVWLAWSGWLTEREKREVAETGEGQGERGVGGMEEADVVVLGRFWTRARGGGW